MSFIKSAALVIAALVLTSAPAFAGKARQTKAPVKAPAYEAPTAKFEFSPKPIAGKFAIQSAHTKSLCVTIDLANFGRTAEAAYAKMLKCDAKNPGQEFRFGDHNMIILASLVDGKYMTLDADYTNFGLNPLSHGVKLLYALDRPEQQIVLKAQNNGYQMLMGAGAKRFALDSDFSKIGINPGANHFQLHDQLKGNLEQTWNLIPR